MKNYQRLVLTALLFLSVSFSLFAQDSIPDFSYALIASKNGFEKVYRPGTRLVLKYGNSSPKKVRGIFAGVMDGKIVITRKKKSKEKNLIPVEDILLVRKINPGKRIIFGAIGTVLVAGGASVLEDTDNSPGAAWTGALVIPFIGVGVYFLCVVPVSLMIEKAGEKKRSSGWSFRVQQYR
jgi:hypothetical protein